MRKIAALVVLVLLGGCLGTSPNSDFYSLRVVEPQAEAVYPRKKMNIGVEAAEIPDYLSKPQMITFAPDKVSMTISEFNRWGEPLSGMIQRVLAQDLALNLPASSMKPKGYAAEQFNYTVLVEIVRFDGIWQDKAKLEAWWTIFNRNGDVVTRQKTTLEAPLGHNYEELAEQQSRLIAELSAQIAARLSKL